MILVFDDPEPAQDSNPSYARRKASPIFINRPRGSTVEKRPF